VPENKSYNKVSVLIVGAGPGGLATAIKLKTIKPDIDVCIVEKSADLGNHVLSGAVLEAEPLHTLLDSAVPGWQDSDAAKDILASKIDKDNIMFLLGKKLAFNIFIALKLAKIFRLGFGQMIHKGDYSVSISKLTKWMGQIAKDLGVEVLTGFAAEDIILDESSNKAKGVKLVDQGLDKEVNKQPNFVEGEIIEADFVVLAEGCDGLVTEKFVEKANLQRQANQLYSVGVKELIKVSTEQYNKFSSTRVVHAMGYPIWTPVLGPGMFGGGIVYAGVQEHLSVGMIVGADWKYCDFNPQHNAIDSGIQAAKAIEESIDNPEQAAVRYTNFVDKSNITKEMKSARNFRQSVAKFGPLQGMPLSVLGGLLPKYNVEKDYEAMTTAPYRLKPNQKFDKDSFTAVAATEHREEQPSHLLILDPDICKSKCTPLYNSPCITFCPAGVYETIQDEVKPANPSNCLHCKTCQRKCPFDNIRWTAPEGGGGPRYKRM